MFLTTRDSSPHAVHLDALRGMAALVVVGFHARLLFFVDYGDVAGHSMAVDIFYLITAFGREAVLAFFVLSGFLIAGSIHRDNVAGRWSVLDYAIARLSRLYVVLVPALILGLLWDAAGLHWFSNAAIYTGTLINGLFPHGVVARLEPANVLGTLVFVQSIAVAPPGSSEQFWSLAYEFWCYALFPLLYLALRNTSPMWLRGGALAMVAVLAWLLGKDVFAYFGCWLIGAAIALAPATMRQVLNRYGISIAVAGITLVILTLYLIKAYDLRVPHSNFALAIGFALVIAASWGSVQTISTHGLWRVYASSARWLAQRSFSLYAVHVPPLVFLRALSGDSLWQPTPGHVAIWLALVVASLIYADLVWRLAERHTPLVRRWVMQSIAKRQRAAI